ncbi:hypothetical protein C2845_PM03G19690 [Panicum miliaceum]|uniref:F-box domain-containing protein n=1 Tax=Panicum miliaceum TaxID=4540 RepID=A0A3L6T7Y6_PANMI|nr:hypothetical protein C2845_PM03G19690 [Panicum miliaceum]
MGSSSPPGHPSQPESAGDLTRILHCLQMCIIGVRLHEMEGELSIYIFYFSPDDCIPLEKRTWRNVKKHAQNSDRISALPDDILIKILSLMTVREAARTDVLSPRWRHLWENVDHLILDMDTFGMQVPVNSDYHGNRDFLNPEATKFVNKVNGVLRHHKCNRIKKFEVRFPLSSVYASELDRWATFAATSGSEMVKFTLSGYIGMVRSETQPAERYLFPLEHYVDLRGCQLRYMFLSTCSLETVPANLIGFSYLVSLRLDYVQVVDEVLQSISYTTAQRKIHQFEGNYVVYLDILEKDIRFVAYLLKAARLVERLELEVHGSLRSPKKLKIRWPKNFTPTRLHTIRIGGFSGESEMILTVDTHPRNCVGYNKWKREESEDGARCNYAREVVSTHLAPNVPSTVKLTIM